MSGSQQQRTPFQHMAAGFTGGVVSTCVLHPLDLIKVRFQAADGAARNLPSYQSTLGAVRTIVMQERGKGLYRGLSAAMTGSGVAWGMYFFFYENAKQRYLRRVRQHDPDATHLSPLYHCAAAFEGSAVTVLITNPLWLIKTRMQLQVAEAAAPGTAAAAASALRYPSLWTSAKWILRHEGIAGLYRGVVPALFLTSHGVVQFSVYEELKRRTAHYGKPAPLMFALGATSKVLAALVTYPGQVLKTRLQQDAEVTGTERYQSVRTTIARIIRNEGWRGFYKGFAPYLYRGVLSSALTLVLYEQAVAFFGNPIFRAVDSSSS